MYIGDQRVERFGDDGQKLLSCWLTAYNSTNEPPAVSESIQTGIGEAADSSKAPQWALSKLVSNGCIPNDSNLELNYHVFTLTAKERASLEKILEECPITWRNNLNANTLVFMFGLEGPMKSTEVLRRLFRRATLKEQYANPRDAYIYEGQKLGEIADSLG